MQRFLIYLFLQTLYMFQAVTVCRVMCSWWWAE